MKRLACTFVLLATAPLSADIGEQPVILKHVDQAEIEAGTHSVDELFDLGQLLFDARFNRLDGAMRPATTGTGAQRDPTQPDFIRTSGPDANACFGCHSLPRSGGAGEFVANVFVLAQALNPVTQSIDPMFSNERNSLGMMGAGPIEMLAREMSEELIAIRESARQEATSTGQPVTRALSAKGVSFGAITVLPDGKVDPSAIEGVDWDLIVKPFHQKGAVVSLRQFSNNAMNHHHGMQSVERFGLDTDPDGDGVVNELTVGDITAVTIYQAALAIPGRLIPRKFKDDIDRGEQLFSQIGCTTCHVPAMTLKSRMFSEPNPFNPGANIDPPMGNLQIANVSKPFTYDMTSQGHEPRLERASNGGASIRAFTDLKRHNLNDDELNHFANEQVAQGRLNGFAPASDFTMAPPTRPKEQFLTRKLWDVGNTDPYGHRGDLTTITDAIFYHGGEARATRDAYFALPQEDQNRIVSFLRTLQVLPDGSTRTIYTYDSFTQTSPVQVNPDSIIACGPISFFPTLLLALGVCPLLIRRVVSRR